MYWVNNLRIHNIFYNKFISFIDKKASIFF